MSSGTEKKEVKTKETSSGRIIANQPVAWSSSGVLIPQFVDDLARLNDVVRAASQGTMLVLCPRKAMDDKRRNPMKRVWCVEEIRETLDANRPLIIKSGSAITDERTGVHRFKEEWDHKVTQELVLSVDVEHAEASMASDRAMILDKIRKSSSFVKVNAQVQSAIWVAFTARGGPAAVWQLAVQGAVKEALGDGTLVPAALEARNPGKYASNLQLLVIDGATLTGCFRLQKGGRRCMSRRTLATRIHQAYVRWCQREPRLTRGARRGGLPRFR